jgi:hypothetical protein
VLLWVTIAALLLAIWAQHERAKAREARLIAALRIARNYANGLILKELDKPFDLPFENGTTLAGLVTHVRKFSGWVAAEKKYSRPLAVRRVGPLQHGLPIFVDSLALAEVGATMDTSITISSRGVPLRETLHEALRPLGLDYYLKDGLIVISTKDDAEWLSGENGLTEDVE